MAFSYEKKHLDFIVKVRNRGDSYHDVALQFQEKFGVIIDGDALRKTYQRHKGNYKGVFKAKAIVNKERAERKATILKNYRHTILREKRRLSLNDICKVTKLCTEQEVKNIFGSVLRLESVAKEQYPTLFDGIVDENIFTKKNFAKIQEVVKDSRKFFITSAVTNKDVHQKALNTLNKAWVPHNNGTVIIMPCSDPASRVGSSQVSLASELVNNLIVNKDLSLNDNIFLSSIKLTAKQLLPLTGLERLVRNNGSMILAAPKQHLKHVPIFDDVTCSTYAIMTTGAITLPEYNTDMYLSERTGYLAKHDHCLGGIIVELEEDGSFHFRQVQFEIDTGAFIDLDKKYYANGSVVDHRISLIRPGDYHVGETDINMKVSLFDICTKYSPEYLIIEDLNNGTSILPFNIKKKITKAIQAGQKKTSIEGEFELIADEVSDLSQLSVEQIIFIRDNHSLFLERYLDNCDFKDDAENLIIALDFAKALAQGKNITQFGVEELMGVKSDKFKWLTKNESFAPNGIENSIHGHIYRGRKSPSLSTLDTAYGMCNVGHDHSACIFRNIFRCGTMQSFDKDIVEYTEGASNWTHTMIIEHDNGSRQLVNIIKGKHRLDE